MRSEYAASNTTEAALGLNMVQIYFIYRKSATKIEFRIWQKAPRTAFGKLEGVIPTSAFSAVVEIIDVFVVDASETEKFVKWQHD